MNFTATTHHHPRRRGALTAMYTGLALTVAAVAALYVDQATGNVLADHIRAGYPDYSENRIDDAVTAWLVMLTITGALGLVGWTTTIHAVRRERKWAPIVAVTMFAIGATVALSALLVRDTSGDVGLAPLHGWIGLTPSLAGLVAVVLLWKRS
jgi:hypothetical protein